MTFECLWEGASRNRFNRKSNECSHGIAHLLYRPAALGELGRLPRFCRLDTAARPTMRPARTRAMLRKARRASAAQAHRDSDIWHCC